MSKNYIIGRTGLNEVYIMNQETPIAISSYFLIEDRINGKLIGEIIDTFNIPCITEELLNKIGSDLKMIAKVGLKEDEVTYVGKLKLMQDLVFPITPLSEVKLATFEEIKPFVYKTNVEDGFNIGIIKGTELMQEDLPDNLKNVAPMWENGFAVEQKGIPFVFDYNAFREYPNLFTTGGSGSGKSFAFRVLMEDSMDHNIPSIVFDIHNEFEFNVPMSGLKQIRNYQGKYDIFKVGKDIGIDFNEITTGELMTLIAHKEPLSDAQRRILERIHKTGMSIGDFEHQLNIMADAFGKMDSFRADPNTLTPEERFYYDEYKKYVTSPDTIRSILSKFQLVKDTGIFIKNIQPVKMCLKNSKLAIIRGNLAVAKMLMTFMLNRFYNERRYYLDNNIKNPNDPKFFPPFLLFIDEAHNFAHKDLSSPLRNLLRQLAQEARKYGVFLIICTQGPCLLDKTLLDQMNTKISLRTSDIINKDIIKNELNLTDIQYEMLPNLPSGCGFISSPILSKTFHIQFRTSFTMQPKAVGTFDELHQFQQNQNNINEVQNEICQWIMNEAKPDSRKKAQLLANLNRVGHNLDIQNLSDILHEMDKIGVIKITKNAMGESYSIP